MPKNDLTGKKFGRLQVIEFAGMNRSRHSLWICVCDCGQISTFVGSNLLSGRTTSCGCFSRELSAQMKTTHAYYGTRLYNIWCGMKTRCYNKNRDSFMNYGGRAIEVCAEWQNFEPFKDWAISNGYADNLSIGRIDNDKGYAPENCRWETAKQQNRNTRRNVMIEGLCLSDYCIKIGMKPSVVIKRIFRGWDIERALSTPIKGRSV